MSKKALKGGFLRPDKLRTHTNEGKGKEKKKERARRKKRGEEKKSMVALLLSIDIMAILEEKKLLDRKGPFGGNVFKNPVRHTGERKLRKSSEAYL